MGVAMGDYDNDGRPDLFLSARTGPKRLLRNDGGNKSQWLRVRTVGGKEYFEKLMAAFASSIDDHIAVYGPDNHMRLTGKHETAPWNKFSYGVADRGASIRVPHSFVNNGYKGCLEDRRPNPMGDPYQIASQILKTIASVPLAGKAAANVRFTLK